MVKILGRERLYRRTVGRFYVEVVQVVILFGPETWVVTPQVEKALAGFHHQAVLWMAGLVPKHQQDGTWVYPPIGAALAMVGLDNIGVYIKFHHNTVAQYIVTCPVVYLCLAAERRPVMQLSRRWWEKPAMNILGIRAGYEAAEMGGDMGTEE